MDLVGTITLPARIGFRVGREAATLTARGVGAAAGLIRGRPEEAERQPREAPPSGPTVEPAPRAAPPPPPPPPAPAPPSEPAPEPAHVDEGATVVAEFAEAGAENGAGAEVELSEPWDGYDQMHVDELLPRLSDASSETLAAVLLYEHATRERAAVIDEAESRLRIKNPPGSR